MIDPSLWTDDGMASLTPRQQLLFIGLFSNADDEGRLKGSPQAIRLILPTIYGDQGEHEVRSDLDAVLDAMTHLYRYEVDSREYLEFASYTRWQRIDRPAPSAIPPRIVAIHERSGNDPRTFAPNRKEEKLEEQKGKEVSGTRARRAAPKPERITDEEIERLVIEFGPLLNGESDARESIAEAMNHTAIDKVKKSEYLYVRGWLRRRVAWVKEKTNGRTNGHRTNGAHGRELRPGENADEIAALSQFG